MTIFRRSKDCSGAEARSGKGECRVTDSNDSEQARENANPTRANGILLGVHTEVCARGLFDMFEIEDITSGFGSAPQVVALVALERTLKRDHVTMSLRRKRVTNR